MGKLIDLRKSSQVERWLVGPRTTELLAINWSAPSLKGHWAPQSYSTVKVAQKKCSFLEEESTTGSTGWRRSPSELGDSGPQKYLKIVKKKTKIKLIWRLQTILLKNVLNKPHHLIKILSTLYKLRIYFLYKSEKSTLLYLLVFIYLFTEGKEKED